MATKFYSLSSSYDSFYDPSKPTIRAHFSTDARPGSKAFAQAVRDFEVANGYADCTFYFYNGVHTIKRLFKTQCI